MSEQGRNDVTPIRTTLFLLHVLCVAESSRRQDDMLRVKQTLSNFHNPLDCCITQTLLCRSTLSMCGNWRDRRYVVVVFVSNGRE